MMLSELEKSTNMRSWNLSFLAGQVNLFSDITHMDKSKEKLIILPLNTLSLPVTPCRLFVKLINP